MSIKKDDRSSQKNPQSPEPILPTEGIFNLPNFAKTVTSLIGNNVKVKTRKGSTYEGFFSTLTSDFDVVVDLSQEVGEDDPLRDRIDKNTISLKPEDIISISCVNVNLKEALDMSQRLDFPGDMSGKSGEIWNDNQRNAEHFCKWNEILQTHKGGFANSEYSEGLTSLSSVYTHSDYDKADEQADSAFDDNRDYMHIRKSKISPEGSLLEDYADVTEKPFHLNPNAKPFTPMESEKDCQIPLVVLPTYVVSGSSKLDGSPSMAGSGGGGGSLPNQCMQYPYDCDEKLYSAYDSLPISAHDYQQYYPHLQYIQYFRRFY